MRAVATPRGDEFDRWASERDRRFDASVSARYVSRDVIGYQDLDTNGTWRVDARFPLGPREVYRPSYPVSPRYFENVNRSNTVEGPGGPTCYERRR